VTMQASMCARCLVIVDDVLSHEPLVKGNGWVLNDSLNISQALHALGELTLENRTEMSNASLAIAKELLDYDKLAKRMIHTE
jgi:1,2-diacylglycerol 3-alpha-glucosyltransferase